MSVGAWEPEDTASNSDAQVAIDRAQLERFIDAVRDNNQLPGPLGQDDLAASALMRLPAGQWLEACESLDNEQVWNLIRFFTLAEMQLSGWDGGAESPVIPLAKSLRRRKAALDREQLLWIREHSDNRYLPYGPL
ncbi:MULTISPECIES: hypothetical protein [Microbulbifer]|uniref:hypothetical protein n=1 Tax=Microbulbifer TaxID=48073 RepID=UPI001E33B120|nr:MULTISPECIES: hypothetical protein [Microbulbifer]UHQ56657.1 hypothetical protein LVE68_06725 [Microbulbifer sp. YPW16]